MSPGVVCPRFLQIFLQGVPMTTAKKVCPNCGAREGVPITYGEPGPDMIDAHHRGDIVIGGCCLEDGQPTWACMACGHRWAPERRPSFTATRLNDRPIT